MKKLPVRANCLDASALVKVYSDEEYSEIIREFLQNAPTRYTTPFCFYEALSVLKAKWLYRKVIDEASYRESAFRLTAWYASTLRSSTKDIDFHDLLVFNRVRSLAEKYSIDLSDAFQIESVKSGYFSFFIEESRTLLVTADKELSKVASEEGIKVWYFPTEPIPY